MRRGTTPTVRIRIRGIPLEELKTIYVTFKQGDLELTKENEDITRDGEYISVALRQEETLDMEKGRISVQIRAMTNTGVAVATPIKTLSMEEVLMDEVIT